MEIRDFPVPGDLASLLPRQTAQVAPFFDALREGRLQLQRCDACGRARHPIAPVCPHCLGRSFRWTDLTGGGQVHSWVRYHRSFLPEFAALIPYVILCVELDDPPGKGPRLFGRLATDAVLVAPGPAVPGAGVPPSKEPCIGMRVQGIAERWPSGEHILAFAAERP